jgi:putative endonuclease
MDKSRTIDAASLPKLGHGQRLTESLPRPERVARYWLGHWSEWLASVYLMVCGYRILARRFRSPFGEVDIIARRGKRLAFVEVKRRPTLAEAEWSLTPTQAERIGRAAEDWMRRHPRYREHEMGMDLLLISPGGWPCHLTNAFHGSWESWRRR